MIVLMAQRVWTPAATGERMGGDGGAKSINAIAETKSRTVVAHRSPVALFTPRCGNRGGAQVLARVG